MSCHASDDHPCPPALPTSMHPHAIEPKWVVTLSWEQHKADSSILAQAWSKAHPPKRGASWFLQRPRCHAGFLQAISANGFNKAVVERVLVLLRAIQPLQDGARPPQLLITGKLPSVAMHLILHHAWTPLLLMNP